MKVEIEQELNDEVWLKITTDGNSVFHFKLVCTQEQMLLNAFGKVFEAKEE